jgi:acyl-CoA thioesterase II
VNLADLAPLTDLRETPTGFQAETFETAHGAIFGAYLLLQQVVAAERVAPGKRILSLQTLFANGGRSGEPVDIDVQVMQQGRSFSCVSLAFRQYENVLTRALALLTGDEDDYLRHALPRAPVDADPTEWPSTSTGLWPGQAQRSPASGPDRVGLRLHVDEPVTDPSLGRALVALSTEPEVMSALIALGGGGTGSPTRMPGNVLTQTVTFVEPVDVNAGFVLNVFPSYGGHGRAHGVGEVLDDAGTLLATFSSTGVLRAPRPG